MGKNNKKGAKANVFKVKSLKKNKAKVVNLGLKNIKQKVQEIDNEFVEISKNWKASPPEPVKPVEKRTGKKVTKEDIAKTADSIVKMDLL